MVEFVHRPRFTRNGVSTAGKQHPTAISATMTTMNSTERSRPVKGTRVIPPPGWLTVPVAARHAGVSENTLRRRVDAWTERGDRGPYAVKGARVWGGRLVDELDIERLRLQRLAVLDAQLNADQWATAVRTNNLPPGAHGCLTSEPWWHEAVGRARDPAQRRT